MMELYQYPAHRLHQLLLRGEASAREITGSVIQRIEAVEPQVEAYITLKAEEALKKAAEVDERLARGEQIGPLEGIPMGLKDNLCTRGIATTCGSKILADFVPPYDAFVTEKLRQAGTILLGKLNMDEFAMGSSTENSAFHPTRNPWDTTRVPGGSSGGSAAAVAAGEAVFALGSDTGGSIRQPASFCGTVGLKPTYGRVSRYGLVAFASSLDQIGTLTRDVTDAAFVLEVIAGHDRRDSTSVPLNVPSYPDALTGDIHGLKVGVPAEYFAAGLEPEVKEALERSLRHLEELGAVVEETSLPTTEYALAAYYLVATAEASSNLARYDGTLYGWRARGTGDTIEMMVETRSKGFGDEVKRRIMLGTYALSAGYYEAYYNKALQVRTRVRQDFDRALAKYDVLATPTAPLTAFPLGERVNDPLAMYLTDICTIPVNLAGLPALSLPCGLSGGLPVGLQLIGKPFDEATILKVAYNYEQAAGFSAARPEPEVRP